MQTATLALLGGWRDFYLLTGTAAATLTGLQFIIQGLLSSGGHPGFGGDDPDSGIGAFGTPTVVHFTLALLVSAVMCAPWSGYGTLRPTLAVLGAGALGYSAVVLRRARRQTVYAPVAEDWIWHVALPALAYAAVLFSAFLLGDSEAPLLVVAAATLLLLCVGIHNAWDTVTYLTVHVLRGGARRDGDAHGPREADAPAGRRE